MRIPTLEPKQCITVGVCRRNVLLSSFDLFTQKVVLYTASLRQAHTCFVGVVSLRNRLPRPSAGRLKQQMGPSGDKSSRFSSMAGATDNSVVSHKNVPGPADGLLLAPSRDSARFSSDPRG